MEELPLGLGMKFTTMYAVLYVDVILSYLLM